MDELLKRIVIDPKVMVGKPVIRGTRLTVEHILKELANGLTPRDLMDAYPRLTAEDIRVACAYAAARLSEEQILIELERKLETTLEDLRAYRRRDPDFERSIAKLVEAELSLKDDPAEGSVFIEESDAAESGKAGPA